MSTAPDDDAPYHYQNLQTTNVLANFLIGASVSLAASGLSSLGVNMQAAALKLNREQNLVASQIGDDDAHSDRVACATASLHGGQPQQHPHNEGGKTLLFGPDGVVPVLPKEGEEREEQEQQQQQDDHQQGAKAQQTLGSSASATTAIAHQSHARQRQRLTMRGATGGPQRETWMQLWRKWQWHLGFSLYLICQLFGSVIALGFVSPVVLAPLGSASLIFNVIFSRLFLGTRITGNDWLGTFFVVVGCAIVSTFGSGAPEKKQNLDELIALFSRPTFIIYFSIQGLLVVTVFAFIKYLEYGMDALRFFSIFSSRRGKPNPETEPLLARAGSSGGIQRADSTLEMAKVKSDWIGALYGVVGGTVASETLLLTKSGVELLIVSIFETDNQFRGGFSFALLATLCFTVFLQLYSLNRGMHYSLPTIIVPIFYTFYTILSLFNTLVYLDQFDVYGVPDLVCIAVGMSAIVGGVVLLAKGHGDDLCEDAGRREERDVGGGSTASIDGVR
ncbi:hypothetical protein HDU87_000752 [Geranomyces variabilis]|uniref:Magnesium transporter n=1 Tax=Geranomyces variabilis TaxID=109894 RepID=A0AAD5TN58_9FUNG|nr:hypothetical protein HDU87_000752 [Geranomyces variabilis]